MVMVISPAMPVSSPVPDPGTTVTLGSNLPPSKVPLCSRANEPLLPWSVPVTCSMATYPAVPVAGLPAPSISPLLAASRSPWNCLSSATRPMDVPVVASSAGKGVDFTSKLPLACMAMSLSFLCWPEAECVCAPAQGSRPALRKMLARAHSERRKRIMRSTPTYHTRSAEPNLLYMDHGVAIAMGGILDDSSALHHEGYVFH